MARTHRSSGLISVTTGCPGVTTSPMRAATHVDDAVDRRAQLGVGEPHAGLRALRGGSSLLLLSAPASWLRRIDTWSAFDARELDGRALRVDLLGERVDLRLGDLVARCAPDRAPALRDDTLLRHLLGAIEADLRVVELRLRGHLLRLRGGEVGFGLSDLIADLPLLVAQRGGAFRHLRASRPPRSPCKTPAPAAARPDRGPPAAGSP